MSAGTAPKQGDHVFNDVATAILRPFAAIRSLRSQFVDGQLFLERYLLYSFSEAKRLADTPQLAGSRAFVASAGAEEDALRELARLRSSNPSLARVDAAALRNAHARNASEFGADAARFEDELLRALQSALEAAIAPRGIARHTGREPSPGIAYQQMLQAAYDPAAALVTIADGMGKENLPAQSMFHPVLAAIADTLDRRAMWKDPYVNFVDDRAERTATGNLIKGIRDGLLWLDFIKAAGVMFSKWIGEEIARHGQRRAAATEADFSAMLHLVHARLQQTRPIW